MTTVAWVFARGGSKGIKKKNLRRVGDIPLIGHAIMAAQAAELVHRVMVSTDDEEIADVARTYGAEVPWLRPAELAHAKRAFDRFRARVESHVFPQVGNVTISIGFARIRLGDTPALVLDSADEALYWAKEHGRNQCHAYETLLETGQLKRQVDAVSEIELF